MAGVNLRSTRSATPRAASANLRWLRRTSSRCRRVPLPHVKKASPRAAAGAANACLPRGRRGSTIQRLRLRASGRLSMPSDRTTRHLPGLTADSQVGRAPSRDVCRRSSGRRRGSCHAPPTLLRRADDGTVAFRRRRGDAGRLRDGRARGGVPIRSWRGPMRSGGAPVRGVRRRASHQTERNARQRWRAGRASTQLAPLPLRHRALRDQERPS